MYYVSLHIFIGLCTHHHNFSIYSASAQEHPLIVVRHPIPTMVSPTVLIPLDISISYIRNNIMCFLL